MTSLGAVQREPVRVRQRAQQEDRAVMRSAGRGPVIAHAAAATLAEQALAAAVASCREPLVVIASGLLLAAQVGELADELLLLGVDTGGDLDVDMDVQIAAAAAAQVRHSARVQRDAWPRAGCRA